MIVTNGLTAKQSSDVTKALHALGLKTEARSGYNDELGIQTWTVYAYTKSPQVAYVIIAVDPRDDDDEDLYWNNENGWGDWLSATVFTQNERDRFNLPVGGAWKQIIPDEADTG